MLTLYIGNKNYSSWSMRPWVLMRQAGIAFEEVMLRFDSFEEQSAFKQRARALSPSGRVPVLMDEGMAIWDSLAICEYLAEKFPDRKSTRLNSSHSQISYAVFCLKKKKTTTMHT